MTSPTAISPSSADWITGVVEDFIASSSENTLRNEANEKAFDRPLVGFSRGDDPIYTAYKEYVGPFHWTPAEIFDLTFPDLEIKAEELTVISWILPQTEATKADNRKEKVFPSERWARARIFGEEVNEKLRKVIVAALQGEGIPSLAPVLAPQWAQVASERFGFASTWSERHAAFAAGLGTFGLCDGLITPKGKAMRTGSVIARLRVPATPRPYEDHHQYCLFFSKGICGKCKTRCPAGAITDAGKDKIKCLQHLRSASEHVEKNFGFKGYGCGLCQTGVPCESKIPAKQDYD
jgi:epoxyqueuosine reductase